MKLVNESLDRESARKIDIFMPDNRICEITEGRENINVESTRKGDNIIVDNKARRRKRARTQVDKTKANLEKFRMLPACE